MNHNNISEVDLLLLAMSAPNDLVTLESLILRHLETLVAHNGRWAVWTNNNTYIIIFLLLHMRSYYYCWRQMTFGHVSQSYLLTCTRGGMVWYHYYYHTIG